MRTITTAFLAAGVAAALTAGVPVAAKAQGTSRGLRVEVRYNHHHHYRHHYRHHARRHYWGPRFFVPGPYAYAPYRTWNGCPPYYTVQDGVCKPYRGY
jgi:hypothetical protein